MAERLLLVGSGLVGLALFWLLGYLAHRQSEENRRGWANWMGTNPGGGSMGIGWMLTASLALVTVGVMGFDR